MIEITGQSLTIEEVVAVVRQRNQVAPLSKRIRSKMESTRGWVEETIRQNNQAVYGVNTGVGPLSDHRISPQETRALSRNLVLSCVTGVGDPLPAEIVRAMMLVRANTFALSYSGVRPVVAETLIEIGT
jgi:histidine ammonia-lyase